MPSIDKHLIRCVVDCEPSYNKRSVGVEYADLAFASCIIITIESHKSIELPLFMLYNKDV